MRQRIRMSRSKDGARIAYSTAGRGRPVVWTGSWLTHLELDWVSPVWRPWIDVLSQRHTVVRYDLRGSGLSDWETAEPTLDDWIADIDGIVDSLGLDRFPMLGVCQGGPIAIAYAAQRPERVTRLLLYGSYARGALTGGLGEELERQARVLTELIELGWGEDHGAFREVFAKMLMPDGPVDRVEALGELQRKAASPANASLLWRAFHALDVSELAKQVRAPTLVMHVRGDAMVPIEAGRRLTSVIPGAELVTLSGRNHIINDGDAAWPRFVEELTSFFGGTPEDAFSGLTPREREVLALVARGLTNDAIADALDLKQKTVRNHVSNLIDKLGVAGRSQMIVEARDAGFH